MNDVRSASRDMSMFRAFWAWVLLLHHAECHLHSNAQHARTLPTIKFRLAMSHVPFVAIDSEPTRRLSANSLRTSTDITASNSPTSRLAANMASKSASQTSRLPSWIGFPLAVVVSLGLSASLYSVVPDLIGYELAAVSRTLDEPWAIGSLLGWKVSELAIAWSSGLDCK